MSQENILKVYGQASRHDTEIALNSWWKYKELTTDIALKYGHAPSVGAAIFAALSPNNDYSGNLRDTDRLLCAQRAGDSMDSFKVSTYGNNKQKAWAIAQGADPLSLLRFPKTRNFYLNINDPYDPEPVTVDGHVYNIWRGQRIPFKSAAHKMRLALYPVIAEDVRQVAKKVGLIPNQLQAIIWHTHRRLHGIKYSAQTTLWDWERIVSGLGFSTLQETSKSHSQADRCALDLRKWSTLPRT